MAFHESHERNCPHCGERMSATAPKCLNCGRLVDEAGEESSGINPRQVWTLAAVVAAIVVVMVVVIALT
jgi:hypothetical protein